MHGSPSWRNIVEEVAVERALDDGLIYESGILEDYSSKYYFFGCPIERTCTQGVLK